MLMRAKATQDLVRLLLTHEAGENGDQEFLTQAAERVSDKLRIHLSQRIGREGFRTLLARALTLTTARFPHLSAVHVGKDGALLGLREPTDPDLPSIHVGERRQDAADGTAEILARFLELLTSLIGEHLTLRILGAAWPDLALQDVADGENNQS